MEVTVDAVIFGYVEDDLKILLIERTYEPFQNTWSLPGGYVKDTESIDDAIERKVSNKTGIKSLYLEQLYTFGEIDRDPRGRIVSVAYYGLVKPGDYKLQASTGAKDVEWFSINDFPKELAFDHSNIIETALDRLKGKVRYMPIGFELLPEKFSLGQIQNLYETILDISFDPANFRKKFLKLDILDKLEEKEENPKGRPGNLYRFNKVKYNQKLKNGFYFEV